MENETVLKNANGEDMALYKKLAHIKLSSEKVIASLEKNPDIREYTVVAPTEKYGFLHEAAIIEYKGVLFAAWYNCTKIELNGVTPIRYSRSSDGGKTWSEPQTVAEDLSAKIMYCPPVFGICGGKLYMLMNEMVEADHMHALDLYLYDENSEKFNMLWSRPIPFKLNTNVCTLPGGRLMLPGRIAELDGFPKTPAVLISDSGKIDAQWRLVYIQKDGMLPDGSEFEHPENSAILCNDKIYMFSRDDMRTIPIMFVSDDDGESWSQPYSHDIPFSNSKIYSGTLSDGRNYVIGNIYPERKKLAIFFSEKNTMNFTKGYVLQDGFSENLSYGDSWHYPCACESDGKLYVAYTANYDAAMLKRGVALSVIDLKSI